MSDIRKLLKKPRPVAVPIAATGETVLMRYWTWAEKQRFDELRMAYLNSHDEAEGERHISEVVRCTLVDADGDPVYGPDDDKEVMAIPHVPLLEIYRAAMNLNDVNKVNAEAAKKNSAATPSDAGLSAAPVTTPASPTNSPTV